MFFVRLNATNADRGKVSAVKIRLSVAVFCSLVLHLWLLRAMPAPALTAPGGSVALQLGAMKLSAPRVQQNAQPASPVKTVKAEKPLLQKHMPKVQPEPPAKPITDRKAPVKPAPVPVKNDPQPVSAESPQEQADTTVTSPAASPAASEQPSDLTSVSEEPVLVERPAFASPPSPPVYPALARQRRQQGTVVVEVQLDGNGVQRVRRVLQSSGIESLDQAALDAVAHWDFLPYRENGRARQSRVRLPIRFSL